MVAARGCVGRDDDNAKLGGNALRPRFGRKVLLGTGQTRQPDHNGAGLIFCLRRHKDGDFHIAITGVGTVLINRLHAAKHFVFGYGFHERLPC